MSFRSHLRDIALDMIQSADSVIAADVVRRAQIDFPEDFADEANRLAFNAANTEVKNLLKSMSEDDDAAQLAMPGLTFPSVIAIPAEGGFVYKMTAVCDLDELDAGRSVRSENVTAAQVKLDNYDENLRRVCTVMSANPGMLVGEAAQRLVSA